MSWMTNIVDAGARYGIHPLFRNFPEPYQIFAFEPEPQEAARLTEKYATKSNYELIQKAVSGEDDQSRDLFIPKHRGFTTSLPLNKESLWFNYIRPHEGDVENIVPCKTISLDTFAASRELQIDIIKADVEGAELPLFLGAKEQLKNILCVQTEINFDHDYGKANAPAILDYLLNQLEFTLVNLDYAGTGHPLNYLCTGNHWGVVFATDAFFLRDLNKMDFSTSEERTIATFKTATISFIKGATDFALYTLKSAQSHGIILPNYDHHELAQFTKRLFLKSIYSLRNTPGPLYEMGKVDFKELYGKEFPDRHRFLENNEINSE